MAPVVRELEKHGGKIISRVCATAQHRELLDQVLGLFGIKPHYDLDIMTRGQSLSDVTSAVLTKIDRVIQGENPDWVLVQGDTVTVMAAALSAYYHRVAVGHVEAGLRSFDKAHPFPEEVLRMMADIIADLHFAPTPTARHNLIRQGIEPSTITVTGNTVIDALLYAVEKGRTTDAVMSSIAENRRILLTTVHRRENFGQPITNICEALLEIVKMYPDVHIVCPVHPNPNIRGPVKALLGGADQVSLVEALDYYSFVEAMRRSYLILTDSGGIQEEAPSLGKPVLVLRSVTERPEAVEAGTVKIVGTDTKDIVTAVVNLLDDRVLYERMARSVNPYGDGHASERIVRVLLEHT